MKLLPQETASRRILAALALLVAAAPGALAQKSDEEIRQDIEYAHGLAAEWGFVDLAESVIRRVEKGGVSTRMSEKLGLVKCDIFAVGARNERDTGRRNELFESAVAAYAQFIDDHPQSGARPEAEAALVEVSAVYANALTMAQEEAVGEEAEALRARKIEVLTDAIARTSELIAELKGIKPDDRTEAQKRQLYNLMLNRGSMLFETGRSQDDGSYSFEKAIETLTDLVFTAGEATPFALRAYVVIGDVYAAQQLWDDAAVFYEAVVAEAIPVSKEDWDKVVKELELDQAAKEIRWLFVQLGTGGAVQAHASKGDMPEALKWGLHLYNTQKREGFTFVPIGYLSLLEVARTLADAGGYIGGSLASGEAQWYESEDAMKEDRHGRRNQRTALDLALTIAKEVNESNRGNNLQLRAQKLIADLINRPGVEVPPAQLFEAAQGEFYEREYAKAIASFKRVLRTVEDEDKATRLEFGPKTLFHLGDSYRRLGRPMEAALAFREGATTWQGDPEYDVRNAQGFYQSALEVKRRKGQDPVILEFVTEAEQVALEVGTDDEDAIRFKNAEKERLNDEYAKAIQLYAQVPIGARDGEKALVWAAYCRLKLGEVDAGLKALDDYLEKFVPDPKNALQKESLKQKRREAMAVAEYYRCRMSFAQAKADPSPEAWRKVVELGKDFHDDYPGQDSYGPVIMKLVMEAHLALEDTAAARAVLERMQEDYENNDFTKAAALSFYTTLGERLAAAGDRETARRIEREMADLLKLGNRTGSAPFINLRQESRHWVNLKEWDEAERVLRRIIDGFKGEADKEEDFNRYVLPDFGYVLLEQQKVAEAKPVLAGLAEGTDPKPSKSTLLDYCRSVTGWVTEDGRGAPQVVPGAGENDEEFQTAVNKLAGIADSSSVEKWNCEWYALKFQIAFAYYAWGQKDSRKLDSARNQLSFFDANLSPNYPEIGKECDEAEDPDIRRRHGDDVLRRRFIWLRTRLN